MEQIEVVECDTLRLTLITDNKPEQHLFARLSSARRWYLAWVAMSCMVSPMML